MANIKHISLKSTSKHEKIIVGQFHIIKEHYQKGAQSQF